jgi:molybdenum cofactor synthesis domain-containing protein
LSGETRQWTAALLVIGDEILSGRTQDQNVAQVALWLNQQGIRLAEVRVVPDEITSIVEAVNALRASHDYLFTTGGIGPTHDDITVDAMAAAFGVPVVIHPAARKILEDYYRDRPGGLTEARLRMARVPDGAELIPNPYSGAPGVKIDNVYILAGVPNIAASMLEALTGKLEGGRPIVSVTIGARAAESEVADLLRETEAANPGVAIGSYPFFRDGRHGANFVIRSEDGELARLTGEELSRQLREAGYEPVPGGI